MNVHKVFLVFVLVSSFARESKRITSAHECRKTLTNSPYLHIVLNQEETDCSIISSPSPEKINSWRIFLGF